MFISSRNPATLSLDHYVGYTYSVINREYIELFQCIVLHFHFWFSPSRTHMLVYHVQLEPCCSFTLGTEHILGRIMSHIRCVHPHCVQDHSGFHGREVLWECMGDGIAKSTHRNMRITKDTVRKIPHPYGEYTVLRLKIACTYSYGTNLHVLVTPTGTHRFGWAACASPSTCTSVQHCFAI